MFDVNEMPTCDEHVVSPSTPDQQMRFRCLGSAFAWGRGPSQGRAIGMIDAVRCGLQVGRPQIPGMLQGCGVKRGCQIERETGQLSILLATAGLARKTD